MKCRVIERITRLESEVDQLIRENAKQKQEISDLKNTYKSNTCTEWRDMLIGKRSKKSENQINILNAVGLEQKDRQRKEKNVVLFGVPNSTAATVEEREKI